MEEKFLYTQSYSESPGNADENGWFAFDGKLLFETGRQEYSGNGCVFASGLIAQETADPPCDILYLCFEKQDQPATLIMMRPDEMAAIARLAGCALWSQLIGAAQEGENG